MTTEKVPFITGLNAWAKERFPPVHVLSSLIIYFMTLLIARGLLASDAILVSSWDVVGAFGLAAQFLLLRIYDEHKDFEVDCINYPDRALQKGWITLTHLKIIGAICIAFTLAISIAGHAMIGWVLMSLWSFLMFKEFFCAEWLRTRLFLYAITHMLVMPLTMVWILEMVLHSDAADPKYASVESLISSVEGVAGTTSSLSSQLPMLGMLIALTFISGFGFEVARKMRGAEEERDSLDSYSKIVGVKGGGLILMSILLVILAIQVVLMNSLSAPHLAIFLGASILGFLLSQLSILKYMGNPTLKTRKQNEGATGLFMLANYASLIAAPILQHGVRWN